MRKRAPRRLVPNQLAISSNWTVMPLSVATPVATIGIRGTAFNLAVSSVDGKVSVSVVDEQDGKTHAVAVYNNQGALIGTVSSNGPALELTPSALGLNIQEIAKTPAQIVQEFATFKEVLSTYAAAPPNTPAPPCAVDSSP